MRKHLTAALGAALLALGVVAGVPGVAPVGTADAASGRCAPGTGVTVVVDFGGLGGGVPIGCDPSGGGKAANQVVTAAGFSLTYVNGQPFVCRIDGKPSAEQESCQRTPPSDAYWGLFWSDGKSATWTYSSQGIASLKVPEGGSVGLRWQDGGDREQPGAAPTPAAKEEPAPSPTPKPSPRPTAEPAGVKPSAAPASSPAAAPTASAVAGEAATTSAAVEPSPRAKPSRRVRTEKPAKDDSPSAAVTVSADPTPSVEAADAELTDATEAAAETSDDGGGSGLTWLALAVVVALAASVAVTAARRRRA